jgi:hypothetical protein
MAASSKSAYNVLSTLHHDKTIYRKGSTVQLSDKEAEPLLKLKTIEAVTPTK